MLEQAKIGVDVLLKLEEWGILDQVVKFIGLKTSHRLLIVGASGSGKTAFLKHLVDDDSHILADERSSIDERKEGKLQGSLFELITVPGQDGQIERGNRLDVYRELSRGEPVGIIHVTSNGYHEGPAKLAEVFNEDRSVRDSYLTERRNEEVKSIRECLTHLGGNQGNARWLITLVNKADIWWTPEHGREVVEAYENGSYTDVVGEFFQGPHAICRYSVRNQVFYGTMPVSGFYDDTLRSRDHDNLIARILDLSSRD